MPTLSVIGEPGAGKSHFAALLYIHLRTHPEINVQVEFGDALWNIISSAGRLGRGIPLQPTPPEVLASNVLNVSFDEPGLTIGPFAKKVRRTVSIPVMDSAGELLQIAMEDILRHRGRISQRELEEQLQERDYDANLVVDLYNNVFTADGFCFIVDASHEWEHGELSVEGRHVAFLQNLADFRQANDLESIRNSLLVLTKYDKVGTIVEEHIMRNTQSGSRPSSEIVGNFFCPNLMNQLRGPEGTNPVRVLLSDTEWEIPPVSDREIQERYGDDLDDRRRNELLEGRFALKMMPNGMQVPIYHEEEYEGIIEWIKRL